MAAMTSSRATPSPLPADEWNFTRNGVTTKVRVKPRVVTADREGLIVAALGGAGVIRMACFDPVLIESGKLQRLLPGWECTDGFNVYALYRRGASTSPRVQVFLEFVQTCFREFDPEQVTLVRPDSTRRDREFPPSKAPAAK